MFFSSSRAREANFSASAASPDARASSAIAVASAHIAAFTIGRAPSLESANSLPSRSPAKSKSPRSSRKPVLIGTPFAPCLFSTSFRLSPVTVQPFAHVSQFCANAARCLRGKLKSPVTFARSHALHAGQLA